MRKITGIIVFIESSIAIFACLAWLVNTYSKWDEYSDGSDILEMIGIFMLLIPSSAGIFYTIKTKFGSKPTLLDNLEIENQIIKKQIEKKELLAKLETLEKK